MLIILSLLLTAHPAYTADYRMITIDDALKLAADQNKDIRMAMEYRNLVEGRYVEERSAALPKLSFTATGAMSRDETQRAMAESIPLSRRSYGGGISLNQPLFTWGQISAAIHAAEIGLKTADDKLMLYRQAVARDVSAAFYDVLLAKELQSIASQNLAQKLRHLDEAQRKYAAGTATDYDVLSADVAVKNARPEVIQTDNLIKISRERLGILIGLEGDDFKAQGELAAEVSSPPDVHEATNIAIINRPELSELQHQIGMQKEVITVYQSQDKPRIDLQASFGWQDLTMEDSHASGQVSSGAIVFSFPFFDGLRTKGKVAQSRSELNTLVLQAEKLKDNIRLQTVESVNALKESGEILQSLTGVVAQAERLSEMAEKGFIYGVKTNLDVQDAQLALKQARGNLAKARRDYLVAKVTLQWVMGMLELAR
jgi:HAE1 family hydrophobic/amphiphilic exporter-1